MIIDCTICLDSKENFSTLRCGHQFCNDCIKQLIEHKSFKNCPMCRTSIKSKSPNNVLLNNFVGPSTQNTHQNQVQDFTESDEEDDNDDDHHNHHHLDPRSQNFQRAVVAHSNLQRQLREQNRRNNFDLTRDQECFCGVVLGFFGLGCAIIIAFIELGIIE